MELRFHGEVPAAFRETQPATIEAAKLRRDQLAASKAEIDHRLAPLLKKVQAGEASTEDSAMLGELAEDARIIANRLREAQVALTVAQEIQEREQQKTRRTRFGELIIEGRHKRSEFARLFRETCVVLGELCATVDEAVALANSFIGVAGMLPEDRNAVTEMSERVDPLPALLDSGLGPTDRFGWDFRIAVVPLKGKYEKNQP